MIRMRTILSHGLVLAAVAGLISATLSIVRSNAQQGPLSPTASTIAPAAAVPEQIGALGTVEPPGGTIAVASAVGGVVTSIELVPGDTLQRGAVLITLDDRLARARVEELKLSVDYASSQLAQTIGTIPSLEADLAIARAVLDGAAAQRDDAQRDLTAAEQLAEGSLSVTTRDIERRRTALLAADAVVAEATARVTKAETALAALDTGSGTSLLPLRVSVESARASLATAQTELELLTLKSPIDAELLEIKVRPGEYAAPGQAIVTIGAVGPREIRAEIAEADLPLLGDGSVASGMIRGGDGEPLPLVYVRRDPVVRGKTILNGSVSERVDTRVVDVIFRYTGDLLLLPGQVIDVIVVAAPAGRV